MLGPSEKIILVDPVLYAKQDQNNGEAKRDQVGVEKHSVYLNKIVGVSFSQVELLELSIFIDSRLNCIVEPWSTSYGQFSVSKPGRKHFIAVWDIHYS